MSEPTPQAGATAGPVATGPARPSRFAGLGASYWKLWTASVVSNLGDGISAVALPWLTTVLTRDPLLVAGVGVATRLPWLLFSLPAGVIVDRTDRRRLMVGTNAARGAVTLAVAGLVAADLMTVWLLYAFALLLGLAEVCYDNAAQTILPSIVDKAALERANGNLWGAEMVLNQFVGPPLGGLLIGLGLALPFLADAGTFAVSAVLIALIAGRFRASAQHDAGPRPSLGADIAEGLRWLWRHGLLRTLAIVLGIMNGLTTAVFAVQVLYAQEILRLGARGFGLLLTAGAIGGVLGSQLAPDVTRRIGPGPSLYLCLGGGGVLVGAAGLTSNPFVFGAMFVGFSFVAVLWNVITVSLRQTIIPDALLGRVNSVYRFFGWGSMPLGALLGGALVAGSQPLLGRPAALRVPFLAAGAVYLLTWAVVGGRLSTANIERAKQEAAAT